MQHADVDVDCSLVCLAADLSGVASQHLVGLSAAATAGTLHRLDEVGSADGLPGNNGLNAHMTYQDHTMHTQCEEAVS